MRMLVVGWYIFIFISGLLSGYFKNPIFIGVSILIGILGFIAIQILYRRNKLKELNK